MKHFSGPFSISVMLLLVPICFGLSGCAGALVGVGTAAVAASTTEKGFATSVADQTIRAKILDRFIKTNVNFITGVDVSVNDGSVMLTGKVKNDEEKHTVTKIIWSIKGVREVINELQITETTSLKDIAKDAAAAAKLRITLGADPEISSLNYDIDVVNGTIYLSGIAANSTEMNKVIEHAQNVQFAKEVKNYITLQTDKRD